MQHLLHLCLSHLFFFWHFIWIDFDSSWVSSYTGSHRGVPSMLSYQEAGIGEEVHHICFSLFWVQYDTVVNSALMIVFTTKLHCDFVWLIYRFWPWLRIRYDISIFCRFSFILLKFYGVCHNPNILCPYLPFKIWWRWWRFLWMYHQRIFSLTFFLGGHHIILTIPHKLRIPP